MEGARAVLAADLFAVNLDQARPRADQPGDRAQDRRFARAGFADKAEAFALRNGEACRFHRVHALGGSPNQTSRRSMFSMGSTLAPGVSHPRTPGGYFGHEGVHQRPPGNGGGDFLVAPAVLTLQDRQTLDRMVEARQAVQKALCIRVAGVFQVMGGQFLDHASGIHRSAPGRRIRRRG